MITRAHRFHGYNSLNFVYRSGQTFRSGPLTMKAVVNGRRSTYRVAVVVSRKVHKSAVVRNRIRRRIYEVVRLNSDPLTQPYDIVLTVFSDTVATIPTTELTALVIKMFTSLPTAESRNARTDTGSHDIVGVNNS
jgi:ribonuclease P protein component